MFYTSTCLLLFCRYQAILRLLWCLCRILLQQCVFDAHNSSITSEIVDHNPWFWSAYCKQLFIPECKIWAAELICKLEMILWSTPVRPAILTERGEIWLIATSDWKQLHGMLRPPPARVQPYVCWLQARPGMICLKNYVFVCLSDSLSHACRFSSDTSTVDDSLPFMLNILLANAVALVGLLAIMCYSCPGLLLLLLPLGFIYRCVRLLKQLSH